MRRALAACLGTLAVLAGAGGFCPAQAQTGSIQIFWDANVTDADLAGYRIYVDDDPNTFTLAPSAARPLAFRTIDVNTSVTSQLVTNLDVLKTWHFGVTSLDLSGNESGFSNIINKQPTATAPPPTIRSVTVFDPNAVNHASPVQGDPNVTVTITGTNFDPNSTVTFDLGVDVDLLVTSGAPTTLVATVSVDPLAQVKSYSVTVTNPGGASVAKSSVLTVTVRTRRVDIDGSGRIDGADFVSLLLGFPSQVGDSNYSTNIDLDVDGFVDGADLAIFFSLFGLSGNFP